MNSKIVQEYSPTKDPGLDEPFSESEEDQVPRKPVDYPRADPSLPRFAFNAGSVSNPDVGSPLEHELPPDHALFSLQFTIHSAEQFKKTKRGKPYVVVWAASLLTPEHRTLFLRTNPSSISDQAGTFASWNHTIEAGLIWPTDVFQLELMDWVDGVRDKFLGITEFVRFPSRDEENKTQSISYEQSFPLRPQKNVNDPKISGSILISFTMSPPRLDRSLHLSQSSLRETAHFELHTRNYGISIPNFRDVGGFSVRFRDRSSGQIINGRIRTKLLFRTSAIHRATQRDAHLLTHTLQIGSLIDLRTPDCGGNRGPFLTYYYRVLQPNISGFRSKTKLENLKWTFTSNEIKILPRDHQQTLLISETQMKHMKPEDAEEIKLLQNLDGAAFDYNYESTQYLGSVSQVFGNLYLLSLVGRGFQLAIVRKSSKRKVLLAGLVAQTPQQQRRSLCAPIFDRPDGLSLLYKLLIKHSTFEILMFFNSLLELPAPIAYFCNHGKDRTGLVTAIFHSLCGVDRHIIVQNYSISDFLLQPIRLAVDCEMTDAGQDPAIMSKTPPEAMEYALEYIDRNYGGVSEYLDRIGFSYELQDELRKKYIHIDTIDPCPSTSLNLMLTILSLKDLPLSTFRKSLDTYIVLKLGNTNPADPRHKTPKVIGATPIKCKSLDPEWNQVCYLSALPPGTTLIFEVWKANRVRGDRIIGFVTRELDTLTIPSSEPPLALSLPLVDPDISQEKSFTSHLIRNVSGTLYILLQIATPPQASDQPSSSNSS